MPRQIRSPRMHNSKISQNRLIPEESRHQIRLPPLHIFNDGIQMHRGGFTGRLELDTGFGDAAGIAVLALGFGPVCSGDFDLAD
jgi:hypothetical protein